MALLCDPTHWIGTPIRQDGRTGKYVNLMTGEADAEATGDYRRYIQKHNRRRDTGRRADRLMAIVGKYNPRIEEELPIYVGGPGENGRAPQLSQKSLGGNTAPGEEKNEEAGQDGSEDVQEHMKQAGEGMTSTCRDVKGQQKFEGVRLSCLVLLRSVVRFLLHTPRVRTLARNAEPNYCNETGHGARRRLRCGSHMPHF